MTDLKTLEVELTAYSGIRIDALNPCKQDQDNLMAAVNNLITDGEGLEGLIKEEEENRKRKGKEKREVKPRYMDVFKKEEPSENA